MAKQENIETQLDLCRWVYKRLGLNWQIRCEESFESTIDDGVPSSDRVRSFLISASTFRETGSASNPRVYIHACIGARTFLALQRRVLDGELFRKIKANFERQQVQWQQPPDPDLIDTAPRRLTGPQRVLSDNR